jgi:hypothetical protein
MPEAPDQISLTIHFQCEPFGTLLPTDVARFFHNFETLLNRCAYAVLEGLVPAEKQVSLQQDADINAILELEITALGTGSLLGTIRAALKTAWHGFGKEVLVHTVALVLAHGAWSVLDPAEHQKEHTKPPVEEQQPPTKHPIAKAAIITFATQTSWTLDLKNTRPWILFVDQEGKKDGVKIEYYKETYSVTNH